MIKINSNAAENFKTTTDYPVNLFMFYLLGEAVNACKTLITHELKVSLKSHETEA